MKLSISWIFDHIDADWTKQDIDYLVEKFNSTSAEIEGFEKIHFDLNKFALCKLQSVGSDGFRVLVPAWKKEVVLPTRDDSRSFLKISENDLVYMVHQSEQGIEWARLNHFDSEKDGLIPPLDAIEKELSGDWKKRFEWDDVIIEVDNKSITHRPDMWGHRGFAREIAALLDLPFLPQEKYLAKKEVVTFDKKAKATESNPISIEISDHGACQRFSGIYLKSIQNRPSNLLMTSRFLKVGVRPINGIVDLTNYLTLDWSQPVHAYDAQNIEGNQIIARFAKNKEKLTLLDGSELTLTDQDLVIADAKKALCLGGVMGGINSVVGPETKSIFFESANFDSAFVRRSALRHKLRTESSMRFEKTLDPNQNIEGTLRFLKLADDYGIKVESATQILSVGAPAQEKTLQISHDFFEKRSGFTLSENDIVIPLKKLGFIVQKELVKNVTDKSLDEPSIIYSITIPTFRSSKDVGIKEDILEEIVRFYGFEKIKLQLPVIEKSPTDLTSIFRVRKIKRFLADSAKMIEQQNYILHDEQFLSRLGLDIKTAACIVNPISENYARLSATLIPGLFKNIQDNFIQQDSLRFFELGRIWRLNEKREHEPHYSGGVKVNGKYEKITEHKMLAGIIFEKRKNVDFYECKNQVMLLLRLINIDSNRVEWKRSIRQDPFFAKATQRGQGDRDNLEALAFEYQTAHLYFDGKKIGIAGKVDPLFLSKLDVLPESDAFFFELDADFMLNFESEIKAFKPLQKYQETFFDLSVLIPLRLSVNQLENQLLELDNLITNVELIDFFEKEDWLDKRSLTFRLWLNDPEKTLEKNQIDGVWKKSVSILERLGAELRQQ